MLEVLDLFFVVLKASLITFSGAGPIPVLQQDLVQVRGLVTDEEIAKALAIGRITPGPNGMFMVSLGYLALGWPGAIASLLGASLPPLVVLPLAPFVRRSLHQAWMNGLMRGIGLGSAGLLMVVGINIVAPTALTTAGVYLPSLLLAAASFFATRGGRVHPVLILGIAALVGIGLSQFGL